MLGLRSPAFVARLGEAGSAFDPDALAYLAAVETADGEALEAGVREAVNDFVVGCKADAIWDALKASCILAGARTLNGCLVPLVGTAPTNFNFVSADYNRKTGLNGNGVTKYLNTNRASNADPQNNNHNFLRITELRGSSSVALFGAGGSGSGANGLVRTESNDGGSRNRSENTFTSISLDAGAYGHSRNNASDYNVRASGVTVTASITSQAPGAQPAFVFARSEIDGSTPGFLANARLSFYSIGEAIDLAALDTRVSNLMTALDGAIT